MRLRRLLTAPRALLSRVIRAPISPLTLARKTCRILEKQRTTDTHGHVGIPNHLIIAFSQRDRDRFAGAEETLRRELIEVAHEFANSKHFGFGGPLSIDFATNPKLRTGKSQISGEFRDAPISDEAVLINSDGVQIAITTQELLGRNADCGVVLTGSNVSRPHAEIRADQHGLFIVDLSSTNGSLVNGIAVASHRLLHGDIISIGDHQLRVEVI